MLEKRNSLTPELKEKIKVLYKEFNTTARVARELNLPESTVRSYMRNDKNSGYEKKLIETYSLKEDEVLVAIKGTTDYFISNYGEVYRPSKGIKRKLVPDQKGYLRIKIYYNDGLAITKKVHRLVAEAFCDNYSEELEVNHIDGIKTNNKSSNLECITGIENIKHAVENDLTDKKLTSEDVKNICLLLNEGVPHQDIIDKLNLNIHKNTVSDIKRGKRHTALSKLYLKV